MGTNKTSKSSFFLKRQAAVLALFLSATLFSLITYYILQLFADAYPSIYKKYPILFESTLALNSRPNLTFVTLLGLIIIVGFLIYQYAKGAFTKPTLYQDKDKIFPDLIEKIEDNNDLLPILFDFHRSNSQLKQELNKVSRNSNVNLGIGVSISICSIFILFLTLTENKISGEDYIYHILPRVTLSILVEFFGFFFLKLYRQNLSEIKYYTNEIINIRMKAIALQSAVKFDEGNISEVISILANTERNFILKKGETTAEIQKQQIDNASTDKLVQVLSSILSKK